MSLSIPIRGSARFTVPGIPPSVNAYVRHTRGGRHYISKEAKDWKLDVCIFAAVDGWGTMGALGGMVPGKEYRVQLTIFLGPKRRGDVDNFCKCALDALVEAGIIRSDAAITDLRVVKFRADQDATEFFIEGLG